MTEDEKDPAWEMVGMLLREARAEQAPGTTLKAFAQQRGATRQLRILYDLENGRRDNYDPQTLLNVEVWYGLAAGQIRELVDFMYEVDAEAARMGGMQDAAADAEERGEKGRRDYLMARARSGFAPDTMDRFRAIMSQRRVALDTEMSGASDTLDPIADRDRGEGWMPGQREDVLAAVLEMQKTMNESMDKVIAALQPRDGSGA